MKILTHLAPRALLATLLVAVGGCAAMHGEQMADHRMVGDLMIAGAWSRATPPGVDIGAGYLQITNHGSRPDRLLRVRSDVSDRVEMHESKMEQGVMRMREQSDIPIAAGATVELKPGGLHLMLLGLGQPLQAGQSYQLSLEFENAGEVDVPARVLPIGAAGDVPIDHSGHKM